METEKTPLTTEYVGLQVRDREKAIAELADGNGIIKAKVYQCGCSMTWKADEFPKQDVPCLCKAKNHWLVKYV